MVIISLVRVEDVGVEKPLSINFLPNDHIPLVVGGGSMLSILVNITDSLSVVESRSIFFVKRVVAALEYCVCRAQWTDFVNF